jgi:hypothetical protein
MGNLNIEKYLQKQNLILNYGANLASRSGKYLSDCSKFRWVFICYTLIESAHEGEFKCAKKDSEKWILSFL